MTTPYARVALVAAVATLAAAPIAFGQASSTEEGIARYREALQAGNPAELWEARGEDLWKTARGPKNVSLEKCDLGLGPGVVKGAYTHLPRYFADAGRVMDLETRLVWCMVNLEGMTEDEATKQVFGAGSERKSDLEALVAWIVSESRGMKMDVALSHAKEQEAYRIGERLFFFRGGTHDFACTTCHGEDGKRIRLQELPNLTTVSGAQRAYSTWPAYRVSQGELRTFQWRLNDCFRQQRFPELQYGSEASIALTMYLARNANGATYDGPGLKR